MHEIKLKYTHTHTQYLRVFLEVRKLRKCIKMYSIQIFSLCHIIFCALIFYIKGFIFLSETNGVLIQLAEDICKELSAGMRKISESFKRVEKSVGDKRQYLALLFISYSILSHFF